MHKGYGQLFSLTLVSTFYLFIYLIKSYRENCLSTHILSHHRITAPTTGLACILQYFLHSRVHVAVQTGSVSVRMWLPEETRKLRGCDESGGASLNNITGLLYLSLADRVRTSASKYIDELKKKQAFVLIPELRPTVSQQPGGNILQKQSWTHYGTI